MEKVWETEREGHSQRERDTQRPRLGGREGDMRDRETKREKKRVTQSGKGGERQGARERERDRERD